MSVPVIRSPQALADLAEIADYLEAQESRLGHQFLTAAERAFDVLSRFPASGGLLETNNPRLKDIRAWPIAEFPNHLVLYRDMKHIEKSCAFCTAPAISSVCHNPNVLQLIL
jgi:plasmid stabilization system protein ParE